jgi:hypothetical protein
MKIVSDHSDSEFLLKFFKEWFGVIPPHWESLMTHISVVLTNKPLAEIPCLQAYCAEAAKHVEQELDQQGELKSNVSATVSRAAYFDTDGHRTIYQFIDLDTITVDELYSVAAEILGLLSRLVFERMTIEAQSIVERDLPPADKLKVPIDIAAQDRFVTFFFFICTPDLAIEKTSPRQRLLAREVDAVVKRTIDDELAFAT